MAELVAGRYEIVRPLDRGGMGEVLLARQVNLDRLVVVKRVLDRGSARDLGMLADEARLAARLHHPNIVSVFDVVDLDSEPIVVMELVLGVSLREMIARAPDGLPVEVALSVAIDLLRGLAYAHTARSGDHRGVVHRDVKPRNVMVTFGGLAKLIDFGISRWLGEGNETSISGTEGYMAPEQQRGDRVDSRTDQYAVGITLREMLAGGGVELAAILARATAEQPDERYASCGHMLGELEDHAAARGIVVSATRVERWLTGAFADRKRELEEDTLRRPRAPTAPTIAEASTRTTPRPSSGTISITVETTEAWIAPVLDRLIHQALHEAEDRRLAIHDQPDVQLVVRCRRELLDLVADVSRGTAALISVRATSITKLAAELVERLTQALGKRLPRLPPDDEEAAAIRRLAAPSFELYRRYRSALHAYFSTNLPDIGRIAASVRDVIAADPTWAHPYAMLVFLEGRVTDAARATLQAAAAASATDRVGQRLLAAYRDYVAENFEAAFAMFLEVYQDDPEEMLAGAEAMWLAVATQRADEATALLRQLYLANPSLVFGGDLAEACRRAGNEGDADRVTREWAIAAPHSLSARVDLVRVEARADRMAEAIVHTTQAHLIHGERPDTLAELFEALVLSEQLAEARRIADRMLLGSPIARARGRYRVASVSVLQGRFAAAFDSVRRASEEHRAFAFQSELVQCLELARTLAGMLGDLSAQRRFTGDLVDAFATVVGDASAAAATRFELALLGPGTPSVDAHLEGLEDGPQRDVARRRMLRAAAIADCGSPHKAVAAGFSAFEENAASLVALGLCAWKVRELDLARRSFERATRLWSSQMSNQASPYHAVLARHHLAGVHLELGDKAAARRWYEAFLAAWSDPDRPVAEVGIARQMLDQL